MRRRKGDWPSVSIVGPGRLGSALAKNLHRSGWKIDCLVVRPAKRVTRDVAELARQYGAQVVRLGEAPLPSKLVWITVPDDAIGQVAAQLARDHNWQGRTAFHSSGALSSDVLSGLRKKGASVASVHPGMTFVRKSAPSLAGVPFGVEGDVRAVRLAKRIVADLGGEAFRIRTENKVLYHAFDVFASPLLVALMAALEQVGEAAGIRRSKVGTMAGPLLRQTLSNYLEYGAAAAFSGPLIRGDVETIRGHLLALRKTPAARSAYLALAWSALEGLPVKNRAALERELRKK